MDDFLGVVSLLCGLPIVVIDSFEACDVVEALVDEAFENVGDTFFNPTLVLGDPILGSSDMVGLLNDPIDALGRTVLKGFDSAGLLASKGCSSKRPVTDARGRTALPTVWLPDLTPRAGAGDLYGVVGLGAPGAFDDAAARRREETLFGVFSVWIDCRFTGVFKFDLNVFVEARKSIGTAWLLNPALEPGLDAACRDGGFIFPSFS